MKEKKADWEGEEERSCYLMATVSILQDEKVLEMGCTAMRVCLTPLYT